MLRGTKNKENDLLIFLFDFGFRKVSVPKDFLFAKLIFLRCGIRQNILKCLIILNHLSKYSFFICSIKNSIF